MLLKKVEKNRKPIHIGTMDSNSKTFFCSFKIEEPFLKI